MDVVESVENVHELSNVMGLTIERMHTEWVTYFQGNEDMIPDSVIRMVDLQREMRACIEAIQFDAQGTVRLREGGENGEGSHQEVILIDSGSGSDIGRDHDTERDQGMERDQIQHMGDENSDQTQNCGHNNDSVQDSEAYQQCPICLGDCDREIPVSRFQPCSHFIHTTCLDQYLMSVSIFFCIFHLSSLHYLINLYILYITNFYFIPQTQVRHCPKCRTRLTGLKYKGLSAASASPLSKMSHKRVKDILSDADQHDESPSKIMRQRGIIGISVKRTLFPTNQNVEPYPSTSSRGQNTGTPQVGSGDLAIQQGVESIREVNQQFATLLNLYQDLNRHIFENKLPQEPDIVYLGQNIIISGNGMEITLKRLHTFKKKALNLSSSMCDEYRRRQNLPLGYRFLDLLKSTIQASFRDRNYNIGSIQDMFHVKVRRIIANFFRLANREVFGSEIPVRVRVKLEGRDDHPSNQAYRLVVSPTFNMLFFTVQNLNHGHFDTGAMLREMRKMLMTMKDVYDMRGVREREVDFIRRHPQPDWMSR